MRRRDAIDKLVRRELERLDPEAREELLLDWWTIDVDDANFHSLPASLREELVHVDGPTDPTASRYDSLLQLALRESFVGVVNSFIETQLARIGCEATQVEGQVETLVSCPCCGYRSLHALGRYEICKVCFWEDDGSSDLDRLSGPNHMTLREARRNFERIGAVTEEARAHVLPDGTERYTRG